MQSKKMLLSSAAIFVAILLYMFISSTSPFGNANDGALFFPKLSADNVATVIIRNGVGGVVRLDNSGGVWMVRDDSEGREAVYTESEDGDTLTLEPQTYLADDAKIFAAIELLADMKKEELVSNNPANQSRFGVVPSGRPTLEIFLNDNAGDEADHTIIFGNSGPDFTKHYLRLANSDEVFLISTVVGQTFMRPPSEWHKPPPVVEDDVEDVEYLESFE